MERNGKLKLHPLLLSSEKQKPPSPHEGLFFLLLASYPSCHVSQMLDHSNLKVRSTSFLVISLVICPFPDVSVDVLRKAGSLARKLTQLVLVSCSSIDPSSYSTCFAAFPSELKSFVWVELLETEFLFTVSSTSSPTSSPTKSNSESKRSVRDIRRDDRLLAKVAHSFPGLTDLDVSVYPANFSDEGFDQVHC
jgi:hypothetical protein